MLFHRLAKLLTRGQCYFWFVDCCEHLSTFLLVIIVTK
jgi:hypothetical protein